MGISERIKEAIRQQPSVYSVAKGSGVAAPVLSRFMNGERDIRLATADRLAEFLGLVMVEANPQAGTVEKPAKPKFTKPAPRVPVAQKEVLTALRSIAVGKAAASSKATTKRRAKQ